MKKKSEAHHGATSLTAVSSPDCSQCRHRAFQIEGKCEPGDVCLMAQSGRQIDRFLQRHAQFAQDYLTDSFWERRAIAARYAPLEILRQMSRDRDEVVRRVVASRLPIVELSEYLHDSDREVRKEVARRLPTFALSRLANDENAEVRRIVASRMLPDDASKLLADDDWLVRLEAVQRAPIEAITELLEDVEADVRVVVRQRLDEFLLGETK